MYRDWNVLSTTAYLVGLFLDYFPLIPKECPITRLECTPLLNAQIVPAFASRWTWWSALHQRQDHSSCVSGVLKLRTECPTHCTACSGICEQLVIMHTHSGWSKEHTTHTRDGARNTPHTLGMDQRTHHTHSGWSKEHTTHTRDGARNTPNTPHTQGLQYSPAHRPLVSPSQAASSTAATQCCCVPTLRYQRG